MAFILRATNGILDFDFDFDFDSDVANVVADVLTFDHSETSGEDMRNLVLDCSAVSVRLDRKSVAIRDEVIISDAKLSGGK